MAVVSARSAGVTSERASWMGAAGYEITRAILPYKGAAFLTDSKPAPGGVAYLAASTACRWPR